MMPKLFKSTDIEPALEFLFSNDLIKSFSQFSNMDAAASKQAMIHIGKHMFGKSTVDFANAIIIEDAMLKDYLPHITTILQHSKLESGLITMNPYPVMMDIFKANVKKMGSALLQPFDQNKLWLPNLDPKDGYRNMFNPYISLIRCNVFIDITKKFADNNTYFMNHLCKITGDFEPTLRKIYKLKEGEAARIYFNLLPAVNFDNISRVFDMIEQFA